MSSAQSPESQVESHHWVSMTICVQVMSRSRVSPFLITLSQTLGRQIKIPTDTRYFSSGDARCLIRQVNFPWRTPVVFTHVCSTCSSLLQWFLLTKTFEGVYTRRSKASNKKKHPPGVFCKGLSSHSQVLLASMLLSARTHLWLYQNINMRLMVNNLHWWLKKSPPMVKYLH